MALVRGRRRMIFTFDRWTALVARNATEPLAAQASSAQGHRHRRGRGRGGRGRRRLARLPASGQEHHIAERHQRAAPVGWLISRNLYKTITTLNVTGALGPYRPTEIVKPDAPDKPLNILLLGSDTREGKGNHIGGETPGLSDTAILLHISADRKLAYGVSLPRDAMVQRPDCERKDGNGTDAGGLSMFKAAYAVDGPACTINTVEQLTHIRVNHFVVIDFNGFRDMVDALGGVEVCVPKEVNDTTGHIYLPAGTYNVKGQRALDYVRVRHDIGTAENGDIGRMKRQQTFLASMANKVVSAGTLANPVRLVRFLDAATESLTTDTGLSSLNKLGSLAKSLKGIGLDHIQFLTVPFK